MWGILCCTLLSFNKLIRANQSRIDLYSWCWLTQVIISLVWQLPKQLLTYAYCHLNLPVNRHFGRLYRFSKQQISGLIKASGIVDILAFLARWNQSGRRCHLKNNLKKAWGKTCLKVTLSEYITRTRGRSRSVLRELQITSSWLIQRVRNVVVFHSNKKANLHRFLMCSRNLPTKPPLRNIKRSQCIVSWGQITEKLERFSKVTGG